LSGSSSTTSTTPVSPTTARGYSRRVGRTG
jgi:hypothetical protein